MNGLGYIYLIASPDQNAGKIGFCTSTPEERLYKVQNGNPAKLLLSRYVLGTRKAEAAIHGVLKEYRISGEWFRNVALLENIFGCLETASHNDDDEPCALEPDAARTSDS